MTVMLYKSPGKEHLPQHGGWFELLVVDEGDVAERCAEGWKLTPAEALLPSKIGDKITFVNDDTGQAKEFTIVSVSDVPPVLPPVAADIPKPKRRYTRKKAAE